MRILDFNEKIVDHRPSIYEDGEGIAGINGKLYSNITNFFGNTKTRECKFCHKPLYEHKRIKKYDKTIEIISTCECGWWQYEYEFHDPCVAVYGELIYEASISRAIVKSYDASSNEIPINTLAKYAATKGDILHELHPQKMEKLVQSVFSEFYACEVIHCGKSHDGGVDLVIVNSDTPSLVQVKRRRNPAYVEPVAQIRAFLGAMVLANSKHGIYVSTADHFSRSCLKARDVVLGSGMIEKFELVDFNGFKDLLGLTLSEKYEPWAEFL